MNILIISSGDGKSGASIVARTLGEGLLIRGHSVTMLAGRVKNPQKWIYRFSEEDKAGGKVVRELIDRWGLNQFNLNFISPFNYPVPWLKKFDIIHLHDLPKTFNLFSLPWLSRIRPLVWTLHSMWPITGGCVYGLGCERYLQSCGRCPQFGKWPLLWLRRDASRASIRLKRLLYRTSKINFVGVSRWLLDCSQAAHFHGQSFNFVPNAPDPEFYPDDKFVCRHKHGIPKEAFTILFSVSGNSADTRKGLDIIQDALTGLKEETLFLVPTGITPPDGEMRRILGKFRGLEPMHVSSRETMRELYSAADVVWSPTRADNCPMVLLEAMACETPVIASQVGGVGEILDGGKAGILIPPENPASLVEETLSLIKNSELREKIGQKGKIQVDRKYSREAFFEKHIQLYNEILTK